MENDPKETKSTSSAYGYQGGYGYAGYSAAGYGTDDAGTVAHRTFRDYVLILRERIWYIVVAFLVVFSSSILYTLSQTKQYDAVASVQIMRRDPTVMQVQGSWITKFARPRT